jgi:tripartite-type tricarboxylate transporter receptor subunit TctC
MQILKINMLWAGLMPAIGFSCIPLPASAQHYPVKPIRIIVGYVAGGGSDVIARIVPVALPLMESAKVKPIAVTTAKRTSLLPSIPSISESGLPGYDLGSWYGALVPAKVPREIVRHLNADFVKVLDSPETKDAFRKLGMEPTPGTPGQFGTFIHSEIVQNAKLIKSAGIKDQ